MLAWLVALVLAANAWCSTQCVVSPCGGETRKSCHEQKTVKAGCKHAPYVSVERIDPAPVTLAAEPLADAMAAVAVIGDPAPAPIDTSPPSLAVLRI
jgi:hypothetical protein